MYTTSQGSSWQRILIQPRSTDPPNLEPREHDNSDDHVVIPAAAAWPSTAFPTANQPTVRPVFFPQAGKSDVVVFQYSAERSFRAPIVEVPHATKALAAGRLWPESATFAMGCGDEVHTIFALLTHHDLGLG